jgi:nucleoside-diphosphate-sugar epimerase
MPDALIGYTGFVGSNLCGQRAFESLYNSKNIEQIAGERFETIVCSGMPAAKWVANRDPEADLATFHRLWNHLQRATAERVVLISTVDVYPMPVEVDEDSAIELVQLNAYGRHRRMLELAMAEHFSQHVIVRLPGLFGRGLKKNAIYDLLYNHQIEQLHCDARYQWYNVSRLWSDIERCFRDNISLLNVSTEPLSVGEIAREAFGIEFDARPSASPARYDYRSKFAPRWGGRSGYLYGREAVMADLKHFVDDERSRL